MLEESNYYRVKASTRDMPDDNMEYGYACYHEFFYAVRDLVRKWHDKVGEVIDRRHVFHRLRFRDEYGRHTDVWLPNFLLIPSAPPPPPEEEEDDPMADILGPGW